MGGSGPVLVVLTGPSGAGKDSVLERLRALGRFHIGVNATDRPPRPEEIEGRDYYFVSTDRFGEMLREGDLLEHARVYRQWKGVPRAPVRAALDRGEDVVLRTDIQGARFIRSLVPGTVTIFLAPPSDAELKRRLRTRGGDSDEQIAVRLRTAKEEMAAADEFDHVVINDDLDRAVAEAVAIIDAERGKRGRVPPVV